MALQSLHEAKVAKMKKKNKNIITDMDYYFRDKDNETGEQARKNTINMTPEAPKAKRVVKQTEA